MDMVGLGPWLRRIGVVLPLALLAACAHDAASGGRSPGEAPGLRTGSAAPAVQPSASLTEDSFESPPALAPWPAASLAALRRQIDAALDDPALAGSTHSVLIVQAGTGQVLYEREPDRLLKPASNVKLFTTAAALVRLGPDHRPSTTVYASVSPAGGELRGDLLVHGEHEYTWSGYYRAHERFVLDQLAAALSARGITAIRGKVIARGEFVYDGDKFGTYDPAAHRAAVAEAFRAALEDAGITVGATGSSPELSAPVGWVLLVRWPSMPLGVGCSPINRFSHNEFADALVRHLGYRQTGVSSYAAGAGEMVSLLESFGLATAGVRFLDGSGLSHDSRVSARHVMGLLQRMPSMPVGELWRRTFAVAGVRGTLQKRLQGPDTLGRVFAKTGTLTGVITLSGYLEHRHDGQRYAFSLLSNDVPTKAAAREAHEHIIEALAAERRGLAGRPAAPKLTSVRSDGNGRTVVVTWQPVAGAEGYLVWRSADGRVWSRAEARYVKTTRHRTLALRSSPTLYVRVTARNRAGESECSQVYGARAASKPALVVIVDGNDRWQAEPQPENPLGRGHDFVVAHAQALGEVAFDSCANEAAVAGSCDLSAYRAVVWLAGEESTDSEALSTDEQARLKAFLDRGGALFLSGSEIGFDLSEHGTPSDQRFFSEVLRASYHGDDADSFVVRSAGGLLGRDTVMGFYTPDGLVAALPDRLAPRAGSTAILTYEGGMGGTAAIQYSGAYKLIYLGFPFESLDNAPQQRQLMGAALSFFGL